MLAACIHSRTKDYCRKGRARIGERLTNGFTNAQVFAQLVRAPFNRVRTPARVRRLAHDDPLVPLHHHRRRKRLLFPIPNRASLPCPFRSRHTHATLSQDETPIPFAPLNVAIRDVHKTGLGSSAAMVTSLTSALFLHWTSPSCVPGVVDKPTLTLLHNLAQYVHSLAQGKVGSGFDVSAAVWGSQIYRRFAVECLGDLLSLPEGQRVRMFLLLSAVFPISLSIFGVEDHSERTVGGPLARSELVLVRPRHGPCRLPLRTPAWHDPHTG